MALPDGAKNLLWSVLGLCITGAVGYAGKAVVERDELRLEAMLCTRDLQHAEKDLQLAEKARDAARAQTRTVITETDALLNRLAQERRARDETLLAVP